MNNPVESTDILLRTLPTPNPWALKFVANVSLKDEGKATFNSAAECTDLPLVHDLFSISGVKQVRLFQNTLTVTHSGDLDDQDLAAQVEAIVRTRYPLHKPAFGEPAAQPKSRSISDNPVIETIEQILDRTIRPGLQADGGDIERSA